MSDTRQRNNKKKACTKLNQEGTNRVKARQDLRSGNWEDLATTMPTRLVRRPFLV